MKIKFQFLIIPLAILCGLDVKFSYAEVMPEISVQREIGHGLPGINAVSPDGNLIIATPYLAEPLLIEKNTRRVIREFAGMGKDYLQFSQDGLSIFSRGDRNVIQWSVDGSKLYTYESKRGYGMSVSRDGQYVAIGEGSYADKDPDSHIKIYDARTHELKTSIRLENIPEILAFGPDGQFLASVEVPKGLYSGNAKLLKLWDVASGNLVRTVPIPKNLYGWTAIAFSPDSRWIVAVGSEGGNYGRIDVIDLGKGVIVETKIDKYVSGGSLDYVSFSPDGSKVATGNYANKGDVVVWQVGSWKQIFKNTNESGALAFLNNSELLANTNVLDARTGKRLYSLSSGSRQVLFEHSVINHEGNLLALSSDINDAYAIKLFDLRSGHELFSIKDSNVKGRESSAQQLAFNDDGTLLAAAIHVKKPPGVPDQFLVDTWDGKAARKLFSYSTQCGERDGIRALSYLHDDQLAIACMQDLPSKKQKLVVVLLDGRTGKVVNQWRSDDFSMEESAGSGSFSRIDSLVFSHDGEFIAYIFRPESGKGRIELRAMPHGEIVKTLDFDIVSSGRPLQFSQDSKFLGAIKLFLGSDELKIWDTTDWHEVTDWKDTLAMPAILGMSSFFTPDLSKAVTHSGGVMLELDVNGKERVLRKDISFNGTNEGFALRMEGVSFAHDGSIFTTANMGRTQGVSLWRYSDLKQLVTIVPAGKDGYVFLTPEGFYSSSSAESEKSINVSIGDKVFGIENYREKFYRPDLVQMALNGQDLPAEAVEGISKVGIAPAVTLVGVPESVGGDSLDLQVKVKDQGGGVGDVRVYLNGTAVQGKAARGLAVTHGGDSGNAINLPVHLVPGKNEIKVIAFNAENSMSSNPAEATVISNVKVQHKPNLHALIVGIQEFDNSALNLQYTRGDAEAVKKTLEQQAQGLFGQIDIKLLSTKEETSKAAIEAAFASYKANINPDDVFVFYVASHGTVDGENLSDKSYYLITSNVGSTATKSIKKDALSQDELRRLIADVPATKKLVLLDTCHAGDVGNKLLGRGMDEDSAVKLLSRSTGIAVIAASTSEQQALEGHRGHGVFTYVLLEGLSGKADANKKGYVTPLSLADYVTEKVPEVTEEVFKSKQYPTFNVEGQPFPIVKDR